jgi:AAA+ ATPase superfamily predicted ATPase
LFDLHPKEDRKELFGRDKEIDYAISQLLSENWLAIGGQREIGKTSFMKVIISEMKKNYGFKGIYVNLRGVRDLSSLLKVILSEINNSKPSFKVAVKLNFIIGSAGIELKRAESFFALIEIFLSVCNKLLLINDDLSRRCGQKGGSDYGDVSPVPLESHDPLAKSLHSIMNEHKMIEMKV